MPFTSPQPNMLRAAEATPAGFRTLGQEIGAGLMRREDPTTTGAAGLTTAITVRSMIVIRALR
jgi:hypothetical protein